MDTEQDIDPLAMFKDITVPTEPNSEDKQTDDKDKSKEKDKKDKPIQIAELRKAKDKAEAELAELKKEKEELEKLKALSPVAEYISKKAGKLDEEAVNKYIEKNKERKTIVTDYDKKLKEKDEALKNVSIELSDEFKEEYVKPFHDARNNLIALIANVDNEGQIKHPALVQEFLTQVSHIDNKGNPLDPIAIKKLLTVFEKKYHDKTGEDYEIPQLESLVNHVRTLTKKTISIIDAKRNWGKVSEERQKEKLFEEAKAEKIRIEKEISGRNYVTNKVINEFDYTSLGDVIPEDEFKESIEENNKFLIGVITKDKETKPKKYEELIVDMAKARHFDALVQRNKELQEELKKEKLKNKSGVPGGGSRPPDKKAESSGAKTIDPLGFLQV